LYRKLCNYYFYMCFTYIFKTQFLLMNSLHNTIRALVSITLKITRVFLASVSGALFMHSKLNNYSLKVYKFSIFNAPITQTFIKNYHLKSLVCAPKTVVNIFQIINIKNMTHHWMIEREVHIQPNFMSMIVFTNID